MIARPYRRLLVVMLCLTAWAGTATAQDKPDARGQKADAGTDSGDAAKSNESVQTPSAREVMDKLDDLYRAKSSHAKMTMTVQKPRNKRTLTIETWTKGDEYALAVIRKPQREAGTATLRKPEGLWNYAPRADRLIRIPSGLLSDNWMGSHFTNDDLMRETNYEKDYKGSLSKAEYEGQPAYELTLEPKPEAPVVYSKLTFYVTRDKWLPLATEYYDEGDVVRTMTFSRIKKIGDQKLPTTLTLKPADTDDEMTRLTYEKLEFDVDVPTKKFSKRGLRREAK